MELQKKKKILLLGDDFRLPSGIGTVSKEIIFNTVHKFDWVQIGGALQHPEAGQFLDISKDVQAETGVEDASVKLIPYNGYGDRTILFTILNQEKPDAILHFTDPRYWTWLYQLEHEIRTTFKVPIAYYSIWDDLPFPMWNAPFYGSCDMIMGISKQSDIIHQQVLQQNGFKVLNYDANESVPTEVPADKIITGYVPHGLNHNVFKPDTTSSEYKAMLKKWKTDTGVDFIVMWNNRNIRRKQPGDLILAFKHFVNQLPEDQRNKVALLMHTTPVDDNGTDLIAVWKTLAPECNIIFSEQKLSAIDLNALYNVADVVVNIGSNEGWGLSSTEAILAGTPIINNVTGGLQDQCGFEDEDGNWLCFDGEFTTNHMGRYKNHGNWVKPVFPANRSLQGSPQTPYIFDDRVNFEDVGNAIMYWYGTDAEWRKTYGLEGREWALKNGLTSEQMGNKMIELFTYLFEAKTQSRPRYTLHKVEPNTYTNTGIVTK